MHPYVFIAAQYLTPQALLSRLIGALARCPWGFIKNPFIEKFIARYQVDMSQALEENPVPILTSMPFYPRLKAWRTPSVRAQLK